MQDFCSALTGLRHRSPCASKGLKAKLLAHTPNHFAVGKRGSWGTINVAIYGYLWVQIEAESLLTVPTATHIIGRSKAQRTRRVPIASTSDGVAQPARI